VAHKKKKKDAVASSSSASPPQAKARSGDVHRQVKGAEEAAGQFMAGMPSYFHMPPVQPMPLGMGQGIPQCHWAFPLPMAAAQSPTPAAAASSVPIGSAWGEAVAATKQIEILEAANKALTTQVKNVREQVGIWQKSDAEFRSKCNVLQTEKSKLIANQEPLKEQIAKLKERVQYLETSRLDEMTEAERGLEKVRLAFGTAVFKDMMFAIGIMVKDMMFATAMKWCGDEDAAQEAGESQQEAQAKPSEEDEPKARADQEPRADEASVGRTKRERAIPWKQEIRNLRVVAQPDEDLLDVVRSVMAPGEALELPQLSDEIAKWMIEGAYGEEKKFGMLKGKMESVMVHGMPHSAGLMYKYFTTLGRLTSILRHYKNLKEVQALDVLGAACYIQEAEAFGVPLAAVTGQGEGTAMVVLLKINGNHAFAEDGGKIQSKKGGGKRGKKNMPWNKWQRDAWTDE
jgi:hypothetical protein